MDRPGADEIEGRSMDRGAGADIDGRSIDRGAGADIDGRSMDRGAGAETLGRCTDRGAGADIDGRSMDCDGGGDTRVGADGALRGELTWGEFSRLGRFREMFGVLLRGDGVDTRGDGADSRGAIVRFCGTEEILGDSVRDGGVVPIRGDAVRFGDVETRGVGRDRSAGSGVLEIPDREEFDSARLGVVERAMLRFESG